MIDYPKRAPIVLVSDEDLTLTPSQLVSMIGDRSLREFERDAGVSKSKVSRFLRAHGYVRRGDRWVCE